MRITRHPLITALSLLLIIGLGACGDDDATDTSGANDAGIPIAAPAYLAFRDQPTACGAERPPEAVEMQFAAPGEAGASGPITAILHTSCGDIRLELDAAAAPQTVNSFVSLARNGYFDGTMSHRIIPGYIVQAGDPTAAGTGNPGYLIPDELPPADFLYTRGVVAMANSGLADTAGSQFFIMLGDAALPPTYAVFGEVVEGFEVLDILGALPMGTNPNDPTPSRPLETVYLEWVEVSG